MLKTLPVAVYTLILLGIGVLGWLKSAALLAVSAQPERWACAVLTIVVLVMAAALPLLFVRSSGISRTQIDCAPRRNWSRSKDVGNGKLRAPLSVMDKFDSAALGNWLTELHGLSFAARSRLTDLITALWACCTAATTRLASTLITYFSAANSRMPRIQFQRGGGDNAVAKASLMGERSSLRRLSELFGHRRPRLANARSSTDFPSGPFGTFDDAALGLTWSR